jgi:hypothetical protein
MPRPCDGCRWCPTTYPSRGATGDEVERSPDFGWEGTCLRGHSVGILWEWKKPGDPNKVPVIRLYRANTHDDCLDWTPMIRVSRYNREPVI